MEDQDRKSPEEQDVEGHAIRDELSDEMSAKDDDDAVEAHALRDELSDEMYAKDELSDELS